MSQILVELVKLANLIITVNKAIACGNRIGSVLETEALPAKRFSSHQQIFPDAPLKEHRLLRHHADFFPKLFQRRFHSLQNLWTASRTEWKLR